MTPDTRTFILANPSQWCAPLICDTRQQSFLFSPRIRAPVDLASPSLFRSPLLRRAASQHRAANRTESVTRSAFLYMCYQ